MCVEGCLPLFYFYLPDLFNYIGGTDSKFVTPVNGGDIGVHIFWITHYCILKYFKLITLKGQGLLRLASYTTEFKCVWIHTSAAPPCFRDVGAENFAFLPPGLTFRSSVLYPQSVFLCCMLVSSERSLLPYTALTDWYLQQRLGVFTER